MKKILITLLALVLCSMVLIVGNASKPISTNMLLPEQTPQYFPLVVYKILVTSGVEIEGGDDVIGGMDYYVGEPLDVDVEFWHRARMVKSHTCVPAFGILASDVQLMMCINYFGNLLFRTKRIRSH